MQHRVQLGLRLRVLFGNVRRALADVQARAAAASARGLSGIAQRRMLERFATQPEWSWDTGLCSVAAG